jgi:hypothetical protein
MTERVDVWEPGNIDQDLITMCTRDPAWAASEITMLRQKCSIRDKQLASNGKLINRVATDHKAALKILIPY